MLSAVYKPPSRPTLMMKRPPLADARFFKKTPPAKTETLFKK